MTPEMWLLTIGLGLVAGGVFMLAARLDHNRRRAAYLKARGEQIRARAFQRQLDDAWEEGE